VNRTVLKVLTGESGNSGNHYWWFAASAVHRADMGWGVRRENAVGQICGDLWLRTKWSREKDSGVCCVRQLWAARGKGQANL